MCVWSCSFKFPFWENPFLQNLHWYDLSAVCILSCQVKYPVTENLFSLKLQWNSFSPIYVHSCPVNCLFNENPFFTKFACEFLSCLVKTPYMKNPFPHITHNNFSPACVL